MISVRVDTNPFDVSEENAALKAMDGVGAVVDFTGIVRADMSDQKGDVRAIFLEHYPKMTEMAIRRIAAGALERWPLKAVTVIHRVGMLGVGEDIVYVGVASSHRQPAMDAVAFIMDFLKNDVPIWKKAVYGDSEQWVEQKSSDMAAKNRWQ